jgi:hypothetical protein
VDGLCEPQAESTAAHVAVTQATGTTVRRIAPPSKLPAMLTYDGPKG